MNILIVDDHPLVRQGIKSVLMEQHIADNYYEAGTISEAKLLLFQEEIQLLLLDIMLEEENGLDLVEVIRTKQLPVKIVILTSSGSKGDFVKARKHKVEGYILKEAFVEDIVYAVRVVIRGGEFYSSVLMERMEQLEQEEERIGLTGREKEVLQLIQEGRTNAQIGEALYITESTTKKHVSNILSKLNMRNRMDVVLYEGGYRF